MRRWKAIILSLVFFVIIFMVSGYLWSDDRFFAELINSNRISTPEEAFAFVENNIHPAIAGMQITSLWTPRNMLTRQKYLWCEQGAIVLATIVDELGYQTRLVNLVGDDGISHHTILEINQNGIWKTYDTVQNFAGHKLSTKC